MILWRTDGNFQKRLLESDIIKRFHEYGDIHVLMAWLIIIPLRWALMIQGKLKNQYNIWLFDNFKKVRYLVQYGKDRIIL